MRTKDLSVLIPEMFQNKMNTAEIGKALKMTEHEVDSILTRWMNLKYMAKFNR